MADWGSEEGIIEEEVDNYHLMGNYEPEEEKQPDNAIAESRLTVPEYEITQGNGKYSSSERTKKIIEQEMPGMRKAVPKEETSNFYGGAARRVEISALEGHGAFRWRWERLPLKM